MARRTKSGERNWVSFSDLMTGLMVIFMFIALSYINQVNKEQAQRDLIFEEFEDAKKELFIVLDNTFSEEFEEWQVVLDADLSIKFQNPDILFEEADASLQEPFKIILNEFLPRYFEILLNEKYRDSISEIRIEGHTDSTRLSRSLSNKPFYDSDPYIGNLKLSQSRSAEVLKYFRNMPFFQNLNAEDQQRLEHWLTANGLSYGRTVDENMQLTSKSGLSADPILSRRVEFRIMTKSDELVERVLKELGR